MSDSSPLRLAVISDTDKVWSLPLWDSLIPKLQGLGYDVRGFWLCPNRLGPHKNNAILHWYLNHFGLMNVVMLAIFAFIRRTRCLFASLLGRGAFRFKDISALHNIKLYEAQSPNAVLFQNWMRSEKIDILIIMVSHIVKHETLSIPQIGIINKHASLLPSYKGIFPYIWSKIDGEAQGFTFHEVVEEIDAGKILVQEDVNEEFTKSMIGFYDHVMSKYGLYLIKSLHLLEQQVFLQNRESIRTSYRGLPTASDMKEFSDKGGRIISVSDLLHQFRLSLYP
tara:strand:- start:2096 stop:2938 length:843 start_codon:yes stop_codon:yes gene_type:complete